MNLFGRCASVIIVASLTSAWADKGPRPLPKQPVIPAATAASIPDAGHLVSYKTTDDHLVVARLTKTGPKELLRTPFSYPAEEEWVSSTTLALVNVGDDKEVEVRRVVNGAIDPKLTVSHAAAAWKLRGKDAISTTTVHHNKDGAIWIEGCVKTVEDGPDSYCRKAAWLRVDVQPAKATYTKPKLTPLLAVVAPTVKAPAGYAAKIAKVPRATEPKQKITGVECKGPKGTSVWTNDLDEGCDCLFTPKKLRWVLTDPPTFAADGIFSNPVGQENRESYVFPACETKKLEGFVWIGDGMWADTMYPDDKITVHVGSQPVAVFEGNGLRTAP